MISIIGAGPSGSYLAYLLAKQGENVCVFEEHDKIGKPVQCTGLVTSTIKDLIEINDEFVVNKIGHVKIIAPNGDVVEFRLKNQNYVFDRYKFDNYIAEKAIDAGAKYYFKKRFQDFDGKTILFVDGSKYGTDYLVGADGPFSMVAKNNAMFKDRKFMTGMQARVRGSFDKKTFVVYLGEGYFGWSVPENENYSRIGVIVSKEKPREYFQLMLKKFKGEIKEYQSGLIPIYQPGIKCQKNNVFLIGDAATHCKASTHGGIIQGMIDGTALCEHFANGGNYDRLWKRKLGKDLYMHLKIREKIDKFRDNDLNYLIKLVKQKKIKNILETYDRDFAFKLILKILINEPRFVKLII